MHAGIACDAASTWMQEICECSLGKLYRSREGTISAFSPGRGKEGAITCLSSELHILVCAYLDHGPSV